MSLEVARHAIGSRTLIHVRMLDRRLARPALEDWLFQHDVEQCIYGANNGALYQLYGRCLPSCLRATFPQCVCLASRTHTDSPFLACRCSLQAAPLALKKSSIPTLATEAEFAELVRLLSEGLPLESKGRVRNVTLIQVNHIATLCAKRGRDEKSIALLRGLSVELPRIWQLEMAREEDDANGEFSYTLQEEMDDAYEFETPLHAELIHTMIPYEETAEEREVVQRTWTLDRVPASLEKQFLEYKDWRLCPLNFQRQGNAVVDTTAQSDRGTTQRFLAYCQQEHGIAPTLATFGTAQLATLAQSWLQKLSERGLMWSTLGNYCNSLCNLAAYWWSSVGAVEEGAIAMDVQPPGIAAVFRTQTRAS